MNIGQAAEASGVSAKMLRYYEEIGLLPAASRTGAGYRTYGEAEVNTLRFVRRARDFGLSLERIRLLIGLWQDGDRASADVKRIAIEHAAELRATIVEMTQMCEALEQLADTCHGDHRPECPILADLEQGEAQGKGRSRTVGGARAHAARRSGRREKVRAMQGGRV